ncbi:MAG: hypothetical protein WBP29_05100, partial [Candidatus Zixiibacteriota bacterium]
AKRLTLTFIIVLLPASLLAGDWKWTGKAGFNYDFISQDYYLRAIDTLGISDDSLAELKSYTDRIDEKGVNLRLELQHKGPAKLTISNNVFVTDEKVRNLLNLGLQWGGLKFNSETEFKSYGNSDDFTIYDNRMQNNSRLGYDIVHSQGWNVELSQEFEYAGYENRTSSVYGYRQHESRLRITRHLADFSSLDFALRYDQRDSYDSTQLDFGRVIGEIGLDYVGSSHMIQSNVYFERKNYTWALSDDDYYYVAPYIDGRFALAEKLELAPRLDAQYYNFDIQNFATFTHWRLTSQVELKYRYDLLSTFSVGMARERFQSVDSAFGEQDFQTTKMLFGYENLTSRRFSIGVDSQLGWRNYLSGNSEFYTDHWFVTFDLLGDISITDRVRFSVIGGTNFEYHDDKEDDVFVYLLSGNLVYQFK